MKIRWPLFEIAITRACADCGENASGISVVLASAWLYRTRLFEVWAIVYTLRPVGLVASPRIGDMFPWACAGTYVDVRATGSTRSTPAGLALDATASGCTVIATGREVDGDSPMPPAKLAVSCV